LAELHHICDQLKNKNEIAIIEKYSNRGKRFTIVIAGNITIFIFSHVRLTIYIFFNIFMMFQIYENLEILNIKCTCMFIALAMQNLS
jgi:hypothetical protein